MALEESRQGQAAELWVTPDLTPWTPTNLNSKSGKKRVFISWDQPLVEGVLHPDIRGYRVYKSTDDVTYHPIGTISRNFPRTFTFLIETDVGIHYFKVATIFKNQYESPLSVSISVVHGEGYGD